MDMMAMVSSMLAAQQGALQSNIAATVTKQNLDAEKSAVLTLLGAGQPSLANVGAGVGNSLNITA
ncbi:hypothetical protein [Bradyrhizobium sp. UFLA05-112]